MPARKRMRNPFRGVMDVISEMNRISDTMSSIESYGPTQSRGFADAWSPTTDIFARGEDLVIRCELPGVSPDQVEVSFSHGVLSIHGERHRNGEEGVVYYANERYYGAFRRDITLPEGVTEDHISAKFEEGLLDIVVRDAADAAAPKRITVQSKRTGS